MKLGPLTAVPTSTGPVRAGAGAGEAKSRTRAATAAVPAMSLISAGYPRARRELSRGVGAADGHLLVCVVRAAHERARGNGLEAHRVRLALQRLELIRSPVPH